MERQLMARVSGRHTGKARGQSSFIAQMLAPPKLPCTHTIQGATLYWHQLATAIQTNPLPPIQATTLGEIARELKSHTEAACQTIALIIPSPSDDDLSLLAPMQETLSEKFPYILNVILNVNIKLDWVDTAPSPVHGIGVFAKKFIPRHTIVTTYPAHILELLSDDATEERKRAMLQPEKEVQKMLMAQNPHHDWSKKAIHEVQRLRYCWEDYGLDVLGGCSIFADPEVYSSEACGHKINDAIGTGAMPNGGVVGCRVRFYCQGSAPVGLF